MTSRHPLPNDVLQPRQGLKGVVHGKVDEILRAVPVKQHSAKRKSVQHAREQGAITFLALTQGGLTLPLRQRHGDLIGGVFQERDRFRRKAALRPIVDLHQADRVAAVTQRDQGDRFVAFAVAAVARAAWRSASLGPARIAGAVGPETALGGKKRQSRIERPQRTLPHMQSRTGLPEKSRTTSPWASRKQSRFSISTNSAGKPRRLEIGEIIPVPQTYADRFTTRPLLEETRQAANQFVRIVGVVQQAEHRQGCFRGLALLRSPCGEVQPPGSTYADSSLLCPRPTPECLCRLQPLAHVIRRKPW